MSRRDQLEQLLKDAPNDVFLNYALAKQHISEGETEKGLEQFDQTLKIDPSYVPAYFQKGQVLAEQGDIQAAKNVLTKGMEVAEKTGDQHALGEMREFLQMLG
ncbi:MAG: hypothetical protein Tsb009_28440 [Planctomycetaceae bacterium]